MNRQIIKKKNRIKDYKKKKNIIHSQLHQVRNGSRTSVSIQFPKSKKHLPKIIKKSK
jgi:hypothetical protein